MLEENLGTLNRYTKQDANVSSNDGKVNTVRCRPVVECGVSLVQQYQKQNPDSMDYGTVNKSMVKFRIFKESKKFI